MVSHLRFSRIRPAGARHRWACRDPRWAYTRAIARYSHDLPALLDALAALGDAAAPYRPRVLSLAARVLADPAVRARARAIFRRESRRGWSWADWRGAVATAHRGPQLAVLPGGRRDRGAAEVDRPAPHPPAAAARVGDVWPDAPDVTAPLPPGWDYTPHGVAPAGEGEAEAADGGAEAVLATVCGRAYVAGWTRDLDDGETSLTLAIDPGGRVGWQHVQLPASLTAEAPHPLGARLAAAGLPIVDARETARYVRESARLTRWRRDPAWGTRVAGILRLPDGTAAWVGPGGVATAPDSPPVPLRYTAAPAEVPAHVQAACPDWATADLDTAREVLSALGALGDPAVIGPLLGWAVAALWADQIRRVLRGRFPLLLGWGQRGSGKTSLLSVVGEAVYGGTALYPARATRFTLTTALAGATTLPVFVDELRAGGPDGLAPPQLGALTDLARRAYDGGVDPRGRADLTLRLYRLQAPLALVGEVRVGDPAVYDRALMLHLSPTATRAWPGASAAMRALLMDPARLRGCAGWLLRERLAADGSADWTPDAIRAAVTRHAAACPDALPNRAAEALAVARWGLDVLAAWDLPVPEVDWGTVVEAALAHRRGGSPVDLFCRYLEIVAGDGGNGHWGRVPMAYYASQPGRRELRVAASAAETGYAAWAAAHGLPSADPDVLRGELAAAGILLGRQQARLGPTRATVLRLDADAIERQCGIPADWWERAGEP